MTDTQPPAVSSAWVALAARYCTGFARRHFRAIRIAADGAPPPLSGAPIVYSNHASWWDPIVLLLVLRRHYPDRRFFGPIDAGALARYPWLSKLGLFPVERDTLAGSRRFLRQCESVLGMPQAGIAMTPEGRFCDVRTRPLTFESGLAHIVQRHEDAIAVPVAIEYTFWNERLPEVLVRFGQTPINRGLDARADLNTRLTDALETEMSRLAAASRRRDGSEFETLLEGRRGIGFWQDLPRRISDAISGRRFDPSHGSISGNARPAGSLKDGSAPGCRQTC